MSRISRPWWALLLLLPFLAHAATLEEEISAIDTDLKAVAAHGPDFPEALNLHRMKALAYARAFQSDCEAHLAKAEAEARPYLENAYAELLPSYRAHRLSLEASLAWSRGQCAHSEEDLVKATEVARDKAIEGIGVARDRHQYDDEAYLRFQAANYSRILGDAQDSRAMMESAIALDDRHGLTDDSLDNRRILAEWLQSDALPLPPAPPPGKTTFHFNWSPSQIDIDSTVEVTRYDHGHASPKTFDLSGGTHIERRAGGGFRVITGEVTIQSRSALTSEDYDARLAAFLQQTVAKLPPMIIGADGGYVGIEDYDAYALQLKQATAQWLDQEVPATDTARRKQAETNLRTYFDTYVSRERIENDLARSHALGTAIWIDATLPTGELREVNLNLPMVGVPAGVIAHRVQFRVDGPAPCHAGEAGPSDCVEIELEVTPTEEAMKTLSANLVKQGKGALHYWSSLNLRIVVDPATLQLSESEMRRAHYLQLENSAVESQIYRSHDRSRSRPL